MVDSMIPNDPISTLVTGKQGRDGVAICSAPPPWVAPDVKARRLLPGILTASEANVRHPLVI